ncbi:MAG TPA: CehA/McbA family metallohydrolase [Actinomycetota bacterium]|nr:CehA/McbA family metallohydrolase [Actinomycetota bacterium]
MPSSESGGVPRRDFLRGAVALGASWALLPRLAGAEPGSGGQWLAGDLHCHTVYSGDVWAPGDDNTSETEAYTFGWTAAEQILIAESRGLDYLAITDHDDLRWLGDGTTGGGHALTLVPGYEHSLRRGHAGCLGVFQRFPIDTQTEAGALALRDAVRDAGGLFILNHPFYKNHPPTGADGIPGWGYSPATVVPDSVEVWNIAWPYRRPAFQGISTSENYLSLPWWDREFLGRGHRVPATGGSDNHWRSTAAAQGVGQPTTWVYSESNTWQGILDAIRAGRTFVSAQPPAYGGTQIYLSAEKGSEQRIVGDVVPAAWGEVTVAARIVGAPAGFVRFVVDGVQGSLQPIAGSDVTVTRTVDASTHSRVRAEVVADDGWWMIALTSPIYFA